MVPLTKSEQMARVKGKNTRPELLLRQALWHKGLRYRLGLRIPGAPDLAFPRCKVAIFVDGCFWHGCPIHYKVPGTNTAFWAEKVERNQRRDQEVAQQLHQMNWTVLRIWEHELNSDFERTVDRVVKEVTSRLNFSW